MLLRVGIIHSVTAASVSQAWFKPCTIYWTDLDAIQMLSMLLTIIIALCYYCLLYNQWFCVC